MEMGMEIGNRWKVMELWTDGCEKEGELKRVRGGGGSSIGVMELGPEFQGRNWGCARHCKELCLKRNGPQHGGAGRAVIGLGLAAHVEGERERHLGSRRSRVEYIFIFIFRQVHFIVKPKLSV
jgi:hypothetical protein